MGLAHSHDASVDKLTSILEEQVQKEIALKNLQFEQVEAFKKAKQAEFFGWEFLGCTTTGVFIAAAAQHFRNKFIAVPMVPLVMWVGYRYDQTFGNHYETINKEAERLLKEKRHLLTPIGGPITLEELDRRRFLWKQKSKIDEGI
ncbi:hypothetical protein FO519_007197 [Halicephalobus sp. NKZ332]|nr:hypothetical protein FO519_007197 [Halicephalobus sp. NKZ332]